jgi:hypothetical protein
MRCIISIVATAMITLYFERRDHRLVELGVDESPKRGTEYDSESVDRVELL